MKRQPWYWSKRIALIAMLGFTSLMAYSLYHLLRLQDELSEDVGENMVWAVSQTVYQAGLLQQVMLDPRPETKALQILRKRLVDARLGLLLRDGQLDYMRRAGVESKLLQAREILHSTDPNYSQLPDLLRDVGNQVMLTEREEAGAQRDAHKRLILQLFFATSGVLLFGGLLAWLLLRSLQQTRRAADQIRQQHQRARELLDALEHERSARLRYRDFVSLMSHQLRTPLAVIDSSAQRLVRQGDKPFEVSPKERAWRIRSSVKQLNLLIARVLDGLRVEESVDNSQNSLNLELCNWDDVVFESLSSLDEVLLGREVRINAGRVSHQALSVHCDRQWCVEILNNLITNAHKYSMVHGLIEIDYGITDDILWCHISDQGELLDNDHLEGMFERFSRGPQHQVHAGVGLGLPIARTLAQWQGGSLTAQARETGGARFSLHLPVSGDCSLHAVAESGIQTSAFAGA